MTSKRAGWFVLTQGGVMLALGAAFMVLAESDTWATVGLVIGLLGGGGLGTGLSLLLFPEHESKAEWEDEEAEYPDPMRSPPYTRTYSWGLCTLCGGPCRGHED